VWYLVHFTDRKTKEIIMSDCCCGNEGVNLIYSCSGGADAGALSDLIARKLGKEGYGKMSCLAGIGADISGFIVSARDAEQNITIDGCPLRCAAKNLANRGIESHSFVLTELGFAKGGTNVDDANIETAFQIIKHELEALTEKPSSVNKAGCCG
jgi:uncharacterized metal-binding protein